MRGVAVLVAGLAGSLLAGCDTVELGTSPAGVNSCRPGQAFFRDQIWPNVLDRDYGGKRCSNSTCHDPGSGRQLVLKPPPVPPPPPEPDPAAVPFKGIWLENYTSAAEQMQCSNVRASEMLTRPTQIRTHGGGKLFEPNGAEATLLEMWVTQL